MLASYSKSLSATFVVFSFWSSAFRLTRSRAGVLDPSAALCWTLLAQWSPSQAWKFTIQSAILIEPRLPTVRVNLPSRMCPSIRIT